MGKVVEISTKKKKRGAMVIYASAKITFDKGVGDDWRGLKRNHRQVTVMTKEGWDAACAELGKKLHWTTRRANILVEGIDLKDSTGMLLKIGDFFLEITGELEPCGRMDEQIPGLTNALKPDWRGGVTCKILSEGVVFEGDDVAIGDRTN